MSAQEQVRSVRKKKKELSMFFYPLPLSVNISARFFYFCYHARLTDFEEKIEGVNCGLFELITLVLPYIVT